MKKTFLAGLLFLSFSSLAQDTSKVVHHEIGFNTVSLIKQLISNNPSSALAQSPYLVFYNYYFNRTVGIRLGVGGGMSKVSVDIPGQLDPRVTNSNNTDARLGLTVNYARHNRVTLNAFADFTYSIANLRTITTTTIQNFPGPVFTEKVDSRVRSTGMGFQAGAGVKYDIYKNLSLYIEVPVGFMATRSKSDDSIYRNGILLEFENIRSINSELRITLPTTLYLVLRF